MNTLTIFQLFCPFKNRYRSSEDEVPEKDDKKSRKKQKNEKKSKKFSKKSKKSKKIKKAKNKKVSKKKKRKKESSSSESSDKSSDSDASSGRDVWVEKNADGKFKKPKAIVSSRVKNKDDGADDDSLVGPSIRNTSGLSHKDFGHALLPGEGAAMVSFMVSIHR